MSRMKPDVDVESIARKPERDVARSLVEGLHDNCLVYHSYPWLRPKRNDVGEQRLREGEADFVILHPESGLLILEVKGGNVTYDSTSHKWFRRLETGALKEVKDPFRQAQNNMRELVRQIVERSFPGCKDPPFPFGYAVVFPDCDYSGDLPPGAHSSTLFTAKDVPYLDRRVPLVLSHFGEPRSLSADVIKKVERGLSPVFRLVPVLSRLVDEQEEQLVRLTNDQERTLQGLYEMDRVLVAGTAGSGKTMLAMAKAHDFAEREKKKVLVLCFNRMLAEYLRETVRPEARALITVYHYHGLCRWMCETREARSVGIRFSPPPEGTSEPESFWRDEASTLLERAIDVVPERFAAVIVDEAQDFSPNWWLSVELLNEREEEGPLYVFYDPHQNVHLRQESLTLPDIVTRYRLPTNCRNTRAIAASCGRILDIQGGIPVRDDAPEGVIPLVQVADVARHKMLCELQLSEWVSKGQLRPNQVAILSPWRQPRSSLADVSSLRGVPLTNDLDTWRSGRAVLFDTIKRFKGLEADALLLIDVPDPDSVPSFKLSDLYVASSRAKHLLTVLTTSERVQQLLGGRR